MNTVSYMTGRTVKLVAGLVAGAALATASAQAEVRVLRATEDTAQESSFELNFIDFGLVTTAKIISTDFDLEVDAQAGTARFTSYEQFVEPLMLPGPNNTQISTGDLTVRIVPGSSNGTYNGATGNFATSEQYEISFTGDLSAFGLASPVTLPSSSTGTVSDANGRRTIEMSWSGVGQLANPIVPGAPPLNFSYTCRSNNVYRVAVAALNLPGFLCGIFGGGTAAMAPLWIMGLWFLRTRFGRRRV